MRRKRWNYGITRIFEIQALGQYFGLCFLSLTVEVYLQNFQSMNLY